MRTLYIAPAAIALLLAGNPVFAGENTHSGAAINESGLASAHASGSAAHAIAASGQVTSAASAMPLAISGAVLGSAGAVSRGSAQDSMKAATAPIGKPLEITDETITSMPPDQSLKTKDKGI